jgi:hypothetical protein
VARAEGAVPRTTGKSSTRSELSIRCGKCIRLANIGPGPNVIRFGVTGTISPASPLPAITDNETSIDDGNRWQGGWPSGEPGVINGSNPSAGGIGVQFSSAGQCRVRGVRITNFSTALHIDSGSDQAVIGVDHSMTQPVVAPMQIYRLLQ